MADGRFRHAAAAAAVLDGMPAAARSTLHARAAELRYQRGRRRRRWRSTCSPRTGWSPRGRFRCCSTPPSRR
ncbi:hypothetical protein ACFQV2_02030 [Actinokineospora soli]|uniref:Uncharacterized protein n=1 Tax=Actinokineospora soli TaxID=1048753 RepID=A0ABW2TGP6_9PSEU